MTEEELMVRAQEWLDGKHACYDLDDSPRCGLCPLGDGTRYSCETNPLDEGETVVRGLKALVEEYSTLVDMTAAKLKDLLKEAGGE